MSFTQAEARIDAAARAGNVLGMLRTIHITTQQLESLMTTYQANTDPTLNAAFNAVFNVAGDRAAIADMINDLVSLKADWEANHADVLGG